MTGFDGEGGLIVTLIQQWIIKRLPERQIDEIGHCSTTRSMRQLYLTVFEVKSSSPSSSGLWG